MKFPYSQPYSNFHSLSQKKNHLLCIFCSSLSTYILIYTHTDTVCMLSRSFVTPWTVALQAPLSMGFSTQEYWSGLLCSSPGDLPNLGIEPRSSILQANSLLSERPGSPGVYIYIYGYLSLLYINGTISINFPILFSFYLILCCLGENFIIMYGST